MQRNTCTVPINVYAIKGSESVNNDLTSSKSTIGKCLSDGLNEQQDPNQIFLKTSDIILVVHYILQHFQIKYLDCFLFMENWDCDWKPFISLGGELGLALKTELLINGEWCLKVA